MTAPIPTAGELETGKIQVVGSGCPRCETTGKNMRDACAKLHLAADIEHGRDARQFDTLCVWTAPAAVVEGKVVVSGGVPAVAKLKQRLRT